MMGWYRGERLSKGIGPWDDKAWFEMDSDILSGVGISFKVRIMLWSTVPLPQCSEN